MALHTKRDFARLCGLNEETARSYIATNVKRGKLILSGDYLDDSIPQNAEFLGKMQEKNKSKQTSSSRIDSPNIQVPVIQTPKIPNISEPEIPVGLALDKALKLQELEKKQVETRLLNLKEEKIRGEVVPTELFKNLFSSHNQSIIQSQKDALERLLIVFSKEYQLTGAQTASLRGKIVDILNQSIDKAITVTSKNVQSIIEQFSIKKEVGEHD